MIEAIGIGLSGLQKATQDVENAANNIITLTTPQNTASDDKAVILNLSEEAINLLRAETEFKANLVTIKTAEELSDELLDIFDE